MRAAGIIYLCVAIIMLCGCAQTIAVVPDDNVRLTRVSLSDAGVFGKAWRLQVVPAPSAEGISTLQGFGDRRFTVDHVAWSEAVSDSLVQEMERRGAEISGADSHRYRFRIDGASSTSSGDRITVEVQSTLSSIDGTWSKIYAGTDTVVYSALLAFQGALEDLMKNILSDSEFLSVSSP